MLAFLFYQLVVKQIPSVSAFVELDSVLDIKVEFLIYCSYSVLTEL